MTSSLHKVCYIIHEFKYGDDVDEPGLDLGDYISDDPEDAETQPSEGASAEAGAPPTTSTKPKAKRKL